MTEKQSDKSPTKLHPELYKRTGGSGFWIVDEKGDDKLKKTDTEFEWDEIMKVWVKVGEEKISYIDPITYGFFKTIDFIVAYPDESEQKSRMGKSNRQPRFLMQKGIIKVKDKWSHGWLLKQTQKATGQEGSTDQNCIYVRLLPNSICYKITSFQSDDLVDISINEEQEVSLKELTELEKQGNYIIYYGKVSYSDQEGYAFQNIAYRKQL